MSGYHMIVNPAAAGNACLDLFGDIKRELEGRGIDFTAVLTEYPGHASRLAREAVAAGHGVIVSAGGDGTHREIARELMGGNIPLGILPMGTGNDLCRSLGIPTEPIAALDLLLAGNSSLIDTATVNGRVFLNVSGFGFDVDVLRKTEKYKIRFGKLAYLLGVLSALLGLRRRRINLRCDGLSIEEDVLLVAVGNGSYYGGGMIPAPLADVSDGLLDICVVKKTGPFGVIRCLAKFIRGKHLELNIVRYFKTRALTIESADSSKSAEVQLDGEIVETLPARYEIRPKSLLVIR